MNPKILYRYSFVLATLWLLVSCSGSKNILGNKEVSTDAAPVKEEPAIVKKDTIKIAAKKDTILIATKPDTQVVVAQNSYIITEDSVATEIDTAHVVNVIEGTASVYADKFEGRKTACGKIFSHKKMMAATHKTYPSGVTIPLNSKVRITNLANGKTIEVVVYDRMGKTHHEIDLSKAAAKKLGMPLNGIAKVKIEVLE